MSTHPLLWVGFNGFVLAMLALDLGVFHRKVHTVRIKEAMIWTVVWIALSFAFAGGLWTWRGSDAALQFTAGYLIEKSLSVDNLFIFLILFSYFKVPGDLQHKVLFWGILGALVMRAALIAAGAVLIARFHWMLYVFGGFLILTGLKLALQKGDGPDPGRNPIVRLFRKLLPVTPDYEGDRFVVRRDGRRLATPLLLVLLTIEVTDLVFALDSIPAIFAVTPDPFIVYTSNVFAILGLRSLYFALAGIMVLFTRLKLGLALILAFVGAKMLLAEVWPIPIGVSLAVVGSILLLSVAASLIWPVTPAALSSGSPEPGRIQLEESVPRKEAT